MEIETTLFAERAGGPASKVVGLYQMLLRRNLEHFFPDALLDLDGDRSFIEVDALGAGERYRIEDEPGGIGVAIEWLRSRYLFMPGSPTPFLPAERRLIDVIVRFLDHRFLALFDPEAVHRAEMFQYAYRGLHRLRVPRPARAGPGPRGAGGAPGRGALDLREPPGLHRRPAAGDRRRPGPARLDRTPRGRPSTASA